MKVLPFSFLDVPLLDATKRHAKNYWRDIQNCRKFFDDFAQQRGLDPLKAESWYSIRMKDLQQIRVIVILRFIKTPYAAF